jgi:hypothetical protein
VQTIRVLTGDRTDRQLVTGIQIGDKIVYMFLLPSYGTLRRDVGQTDCATYSLLEVAHFVFWAKRLLKGEKPISLALIRSFALLP